jgi:hypothetical protein
MSAHNSFEETGKLPGKSGDALHVPPLTFAKVNVEGVDKGSPAIQDAIKGIWDGMLYNDAREISFVYHDLLGGDKKKFWDLVGAVQNAFNKGVQSAKLAASITDYQTKRELTVNNGGGNNALFTLDRDPDDIPPAIRAE